MFDVRRLYDYPSASGIEKRKKNWDQSVLKVMTRTLNIRDALMFFVKWTGFDIYYESNHGKNRAHPAHPLLNIDKLCFQETGIMSLWAISLNLKDVDSLFAA